ncbi:MAG: EutN/CcmL family microcompartment protein [Pirellulales bacterium]|nr:EutN/CcmL family microcompartment protein [Planctomycetales bacterium]
MQLALILGHATATVKHGSMAGSRMAVLQPLSADGYSPDGDPAIAIDRLGSSRGDVVIISSDSEQVQEILSSKTTPVRWSVLGIRD